MLTHLLRLLRRLQAEDGQTLVEYALLLALIGVVTIAILISLGQGLVEVFTSVSNAF